MTVLQQPLIWSKSQVASYRDCSRKGFFSTSNDSLLLNGQAQQLKKIKNRYLWAGAVIHSQIGDLIKLVRQNGDMPTEDSFVNNARDRMRQEFRVSQEASNPESRLFEHEYQISMPKETWQNQWNQVEKSLRWFMKSNWFSRLKSLGPETWKAVDEILSFDVEGIKAYVKIDCAMDVDGKIILIDWKTSALKKNDAESLSVAALYAHEVWGAEPDQVSAYAVSLVDGRSTTVSIDEDVLMETVLRIQEEVQFLEEKKSAQTDNPFSLPVAHPSICERCNFQKLCHPKGL